MNKIIENLTFTVPLSFEAHSIAEQSRKGITNPEKSKQVYLNSLAVYAVNYYLQGMGFETDWENSDHRDPITVKLSDLADLEVKNVGKLECHPILSDEDSFKIPPEVTEGRIGYVAVQLTPSLKEATILGYVSTPTKTVSLSQLKSLEDFLFDLTTLEVEATTSPLLPQLGNWLEGVVEKGWLRVEELFNAPPLGLAFMKEVSVIRGQALDLGMQLNHISIALIVKVSSSESIGTTEADLLIQVRPMTETVLPEGIELQVKDALGENILKTTSRKGDNWIQLAFSAESGEKFQVTVAYQDAALTKDFVI